MKIVRTQIPKDDPMRVLHDGIVRGEMPEPVKFTNTLKRAPITHAAITSESDTPETDANRCDVDTYAGEYLVKPATDGEWVRFEFAQALERQRDAAIKLADDVAKDSRVLKEKYGIGDRHVMREKNAEIKRWRTLATKLANVSSLDELREASQEFTKLNEHP